jgi:hypothetical protein
LAPLPGLTGLTFLTILTVLTCPAITTVAADGLTVNNFAIQDDWITIGIEIHRASVADTTIATGRAGSTFKAVRTRLTGQTSFAILTGKTICHSICHCIGIVEIRLFRPVGVVRRPMVRVKRVGYRRIPCRVKWIQRI